MDVVFQLLMFWLNAVALENMWVMSVTALVFQLLMFWLNAVALENMYFMSVTALVFQLRNLLGSPYSS